MQWCSRCLTRFLAATRLPKVKAEKAMMTATDNEVELGKTACMPFISSECPGSSKHRHDTHLFLDVHDPCVRFQNAVRAVIKL
jgi:hypothetical protein